MVLVGWRLMASAALLLYASAAPPILYLTTIMKVLVLPEDTPPGTIVFRLQASDYEHNYPLQFSISGTLLQVKPIPCTPEHIFCKANVVLAQKLVPGREQIVKLTLKNSKGESTGPLDCSIRSSRHITHYQAQNLAFPIRPMPAMVPEDAKLKTKLFEVIARNSPKNSRFTQLELDGDTDNMFELIEGLDSNETVRGEVFLNKMLDFETRPLYRFRILALDPYVEGNDTRNIIPLDVAVVVQDVQDMKPEFISPPPITKVANFTQPGDVILHIQAKDGDREHPRRILYGIAPENNAFASFFEINETSGVIKLTRNLSELGAILPEKEPVTLTIIAQEIKDSVNEPPALSSSVEIALFFNYHQALPPHFSSRVYMVQIDENSPQATPLVISGSHELEVRDDDLGKDSVFAIELEHNNDTFEVTPRVGEKFAVLSLLVQNNALLDYETHQVLHLDIIAKEIKPDPGLVSKARVIVYVKDVNDNSPEFDQPVYTATIAENITAGMSIIQVHATDRDTDYFGEIRYTRIMGHKNNTLLIDPKSGAISVAVVPLNIRLDREESKEYQFEVEARDEAGEGLRTTVPLKITLLDVNDNPPIFDRDLYEVLLSVDFASFTSRIFLHATDVDAEAPNNIVRYEIQAGNYENRYSINNNTGELTVAKPELEPPQLFAELTVRAYDLGVPHLSSKALVRIYPPESHTRTLTYIVSGRAEDNKEKIPLVEKRIAEISGGRVNIHNISRYTGNEHGNDLTSSDITDSEKSVVIATIHYNPDRKTVVDLSRLTFGQNSSSNQNSNPSKASVGIVPRGAPGFMFWLMLILACLIIALIIYLLFCCLCPGCPLYVQAKKDAENQQIHEEVKSVKMIVEDPGPGKETKSCQVGQISARDRSGRRREAWSGDARLYQSWRFNRRNIRGKIHAAPAAASAEAASNTPPGEDSLPALIYTRELQNRSMAPNGDVFVEDLEYLPGTVHHSRHYGPNRQDGDSDSMRRHEAERGSLSADGAIHSDWADRREFRRPPRHGQISRRDRDYNHENERDRDYASWPDRDRESLQWRERGRERDLVHWRDHDRERWRDRDVFWREKERDREREREREREQEREREREQERERERVLEREREREHEREKERERDINSWRDQEHISPRDTEAEPSSRDRDQVYWREGNAEVMRLVTRGREEQGKDIIMRRFMADQELQEALQLEELLLQRRRRLLMELTAAEEALETQSLPQVNVMETSQVASTQTSPPPAEIRRRARSDTEEDLTSTNGGAINNERINIRGKRTRGRVIGTRRLLKRKVPAPRIKTPIAEETESALEAAERQGYSETKTSMLRRRRIAENTQQIPANFTSSGSLEDENEEADLYIEDGDDEIFEDSLEDDENKNKKKKYQREKEEENKKITKEEAEVKLLKGKNKKNKKLKTKSAILQVLDEPETMRSNSVTNLQPPKVVDQRRGSEPNIQLSTTKTTKESISPDETNENQDQTRKPRYMEWYKNKQESKKQQQNKEKPKTVASKSGAKAKTNAKTIGKTEEDDIDSGIAMSSLVAGRPKRIAHPLLEKKSVFTIAYHDMDTQQLRPDSNTPTY